MMTDNSQMVNEWSLSKVGKVFNNHTCILSAWYKYYKGRLISLELNTYSLASDFFYILAHLTVEGSQAQPIIM